MLLDVLPDDVDRRTATTTGKVAGQPQKVPCLQFPLNAGIVSFSDKKARHDRWDKPGWLLQISRLLAGVGPRTRQSDSGSMRCLSAGGLLLFQGEKVVNYHTGNQMFGTQGRSRR